MSGSAPGLDGLFLEFQLALAGRYSIDRELGRGGMGIVYLAREVHLDRLIAIKLLPPEHAADPMLRERFVREARLAAKLSHPHIIPIHAVDEHAGFVFYVMAFVDGETLAHRVRTRGPVTATDGSRILREVAWALSYAHGQGLVHRDVKPDNILLESGSGRALVADFGIAAAVGDLAVEGVAGTPEFMSPEQALGNPVDARSDLYSLGATGFYAFSGRFVFEGDTATEVLAKQVTAPPPTLASLGLPVPRRLAGLIDKCLAKDPAHRPNDAAALAEQLASVAVPRREVPALLRDFVKRTGRVDGAGTLVGATMLAVGSVMAAAVYGGSAGFATLALGGTLVPLSYLVHSARALVAAGFMHRDLEPAFRGVLEQVDEERTAVHGQGKRRVERVLRAVSMVTVPVSALALGTLLVVPGVVPGFWRYAEAVFSLFAITGPLAVASGIGYVMRVQLYRDVDTAFWGRVWTGRIGRALFAIAKKLTPDRRLAGAMTHRATELSLSVAAEQLFDRLPKESRDALRDLPGVLHRLQEDAQRLRARHDAIADALAVAGEAGTSELYGDLRERRDEARAKLTTAVGALESIRLNLLRLHAGAETVEGLTTQLGLAAEVSAEVERLIAAREEVEGMLRFPGAIARTPA